METNESSRAVRVDGEVIQAVQVSPAGEEQKRLASHMHFGMVGSEMATPALSSRMQSAVAEYGVFWQLWPQFESTRGDRRLVGLEVELIGSHTPDLNHLDPACPSCDRLRSVLLEIANPRTQFCVCPRWGIVRWYG